MISDFWHNAWDMTFTKMLVKWIKEWMNMTTWIKPATLASYFHLLLGERNLGVNTSAHCVIYWFSGKKSPCQYRRPRFNPCIGRSPWRGKWQPSPVFLPEKSHGPRSLVGCSPWTCKRVRHSLVTKQQHFDRGWDGWMASLTQWTRVWVNSRSWQWTRKPGVLQSKGSQRVERDWATELNWVNCELTI